MKRLLLALFIPVWIVTVLNYPLIWALFKAEYLQPSVRVVRSFAPKDQTDNTLEITSLNLSAPIIGSPVDPTETADWKILARDLANGVSLAEKFARPGEPGTTLILGHSSEIVPRRYSAIFAGLNNLNLDDVINIKYHGQAYRYQAIAKKIVSPTDPLFQSFKLTDRANQLVLVTCWPLLTTAKRLIIVAMPI